MPLGVAIALVRISPTIKIAFDLSMLATFAQLTIPLIASATMVLMQLVREWSGGNGKMLPRLRRPGEASRHAWTDVDTWTSCS